MRVAFRNAIANVSAARRQKLRNLVIQRANNLKAARLKALNASKNLPQKPPAPVPKPPGSKRTDDITRWVRTPTAASAPHIPEDLQRSLKEQVNDSSLNTHFLATEFEKANRRTWTRASKVTPEEQERIRKLLTTIFNKRSS